MNFGLLDKAQERSRSQVDLSPLTESTPERTAARSEVRRRLEQAIDDLPAAFRIALMMRDTEEASVDETASALGIKPETVRTRLHRARRMLRESLGEQHASMPKDTFPFDQPRCDALVSRALAEIRRRDDDRARRCL